MKKVKEMTVCMGTGKVCFRVRDAYNQLIEVMQGIDALKAGEQNDTMAYEVAHTAMMAVKNDLSKQVHKTCLNCEVEAAKQAVKKAEKSIREAVRVCNEASDIVLCRLLADKEHFEISKLYNLWDAARLTDLDCIEAELALLEAYNVRNIAREVLKVKQELLNRLCPQGIELDKI